MVVFIIMGVFAHWEDRILATSDMGTLFRLVADLSCACHAPHTFPIHRPKW